MLLRFELKKLLSRRFLKAFVFLLLFINAFNIYQNYDVFITPEKGLSAGEYVSFASFRYAMDKDYEGPVTQEKADRLNAHIRRAAEAYKTGNLPWEEGYFRLPGGDKLAGEALLEEMERLYNYNKNVVEPMLKKNSEMASSGSAYSKRICSMIDRIYSGRSISEYYRVNEYRPLLSYKLSSLFLMLLAIYAAAGLFAGERESHMYALQKSTALGSSHIFFTKLVALAIFVLILGLLFYAEDLLMFTLCRRPSGLHLPLWAINDAISDYSFSPVNLSVGGFVALLWAVRSLGIFATAMIGVVFSLLLKRSFGAFLASLPCIAGLMTLTMFTDGVLSAVRYFNPVTLLIYPRLCESFLLQNVLGIPVQAHVLAPICCSFLLVVLMASSFLLYKRRNAND